MGNDGDGGGSEGDGGGGVSYDIRKSQYWGIGGVVEGAGGLRRLLVTSSLFLIRISLR